MTPVKAAKQKFGMRPSRGARTASTFRLNLLMEEQQRLEIGARIKELRERSPHKQPYVAARLHIGTRAYQKVENKGTTSYERCQAIAKIHAHWTHDHPDWKHATADWLWDGRMPAAETPDLLGALAGGARAQLDRIEQRLDAIYGLIKPTDAATVEEELGAAPPTDAARKPSTARTSRARKRAEG